MKVIPVNPRGYCPGVIRAIRILDNVLADPAYPRPIHLLGMIVHNAFVVDDFRQKGVLVHDDPGKTRLELLEDIREGTVVVTAHGAGDDVFRRIREKGLSCVDATCRDVYRTRDLIKDRLASGDSVLFIGKAGHPETEGVLSHSPKILLVEKLQDVASLPVLKGSVFVTNQTTFSLKEIGPVLEAVKARFPQAQIAEEICSSTRLRQEALLAALPGADACVVVGDPRSNNTANLALLAQGAGLPAFRVASAADLRKEWFSGMGILVVTSGASTPPAVTAQVLRVLESW